ncbi:hypothetical protein GIS00_12655 [Nakamurella sp. YIM 132087]|uniref:Uncharacterized protein n=1 Tax=Nakamurella alba TaxID=2665158 RepID=A0A7K1FKX3_9ACTN|nr:hypothetical protein [Nakamurella alba]MTD14791.1 hypothetical protein [Nakamurella alba]
MASGPGAAARRIARDAVHTFVTGPVRANVVRAHGGGVPAVVAVVLGTIGVAVPTVMLAFLGPLQRSASGFGADGLPGAPTFELSGLVPVTLALLVLAGTVGLAGSVFAAPVPRVLGSVLVLVVGGSMSASAHRFDSEPFLAVTGVVCTVLAAALPWVLRPLLAPTAGPPPAADRVHLTVAALLPVCAVLVSGAVVAPTLAVFLRLDLSTPAEARQTLGVLWRASVSQVLPFFAPLVYLGGAGLVLVAVTTSRFLSRSVRTAGGRTVWVLLAAVLALLGWRWYRVVRVRTGEDPVVLLLQVLIGVATLALATWWWFRVARGGGADDDDPEEGSARGIPVVTVAVLAPALLAAVAVVLADQVDAWSAGPGTVATTAFGDAALGVSDWLGSTGPAFWCRVLVAGGAVGWALLRIRRGQPGALTAWVGIFGALDLIRAVYQQVSGEPSPAGVAVWQDVLVVVVTVCVVIEWVGHRLPSRRFLVLAAAALLFSGLVVQQDFADAGAIGTAVGFLGAAGPVLAAVWALLTTGGHAEGSGTDGLGRSLLVLGYLGLGATLALWPAFGGDLAAVGLGTAGIGEAARAALGDSLTLAIMAAFLVRLLRRRPVPGPAPAPAQPAGSGAPSSSS